MSGCLDRPSLHRIAFLAVAALIFAACGGAESESASNADAAISSTADAVEAVDDVVVAEDATTEAPSADSDAAAVAEPDTSTAAPATTTTTEAAAEPLEQVIDPSSPLNGTFATVGGESIDLGSLQGQDVVLWFWAPW